MEWRGVAWRGCLVGLRSPVSRGQTGKALGPCAAGDLAFTLCAAHEGQCWPEINRCPFCTQSSGTGWSVLSHIMQFAFFRRFGPLSPTGLALAGPKWNMPWYLGSIAPEGADAQLPRVTPSSRASSCCSCSHIQRPPSPQAASWTPVACGPGCPPLARSWWLRLGAALSRVGDICFHNPGGPCCGLWPICWPCGPGAEWAHSPEMP